MTGRPEADESDFSRRWMLSPWLAVPAGAITWWLVGFLPWVADGLRTTELTGGIRTAIPLLSEELTGLVVMAVLGGTAAVAGARSRRLHRCAAAGCAAAGAAAAVVVATLHAQHTAQTLMGPVASDPQVVHGLALVAYGATLVGIALGLVAATGPIWMVPVALAGPAALLPGWLDQLLGGSLADSSRWVFAVALGTLLGLCVRRPVHLLVWAPAAAIAWVAQAGLPALLAVGSTIRPGYGLDDDPWLPASVGADVFEAALTTPEAHWPAAWIAALTLALLIIATHPRSRRRSS